MTQDGHAIELQANLELPIELPLVAQSGAHGIGLLRTEFLFMNRESVPDEDTQTETYRTIIEAMNGDPVSIRVLDWGGEKDIEALSSEGIVPDVVDTNPALGVRGIRLLLRRPRLFETQLAAILRASAAGPTRVMLPMITNVDGSTTGARDLRARHSPAPRRGRGACRDPLPPLGIMIETPGAALSADALALEADFFAIGTNDLTMYTVAVDRGETDVAHLYDPLHPGGAAARAVLDVEAALPDAHARLGLRRNGGQSEIHAAAPRARAAQLQHERLGRAARETGRPRGRDRRLRAARPTRHGPVRRGADPRPDRRLRPGQRYRRIKPTKAVSASVSSSPVRTWTRSSHRSGSRRSPREMAHYRHAASDPSR